MLTIQHRLRDDRVRARHVRVIFYVHVVIQGNGKKLGADSLAVLLYLDSHLYLSRSSQRQSRSGMYHVSNAYFGNVWSQSESKNLSYSSTSLYATLNTSFNFNVSQCQA